MKKLFFLMIAAVAMSFVACTSEENNEASASDAASTSVAVAEFNADNFAAQLDSLLAANDTVGAKALLEQASKKIEDLKAQGGNEDELAKLIATVKTAVEGKAEALKGLGLTELATKVAEVPENLKEKVDGAVKDLATEAKDAAVEKANEVKDAAVEKANEDVWMGAFGKFLFIGVVTTILSFLLTWLVRMIPGVKRIL